MTDVTYRLIIIKERTAVCRVRSLVHTICFFVQPSGLKREKKRRSGGPRCTNYAMFVQRSPHRSIVFWPGDCPPAKTHQLQPLAVSANWIPISFCVSRMLAWLVASLGHAAVHMGWMLAGFCWTSQYSAYVYQALLIVHNTKLLNIQRERSIQHIGGARNCAQ